MELMRRRSIEATIAASDEPERHLRRTLGAWDLVVLGISVVIGAGIFSKAAMVSATQTGPAVVISFLIAGTVCALAALCYAEFASHMPVAGSAYTYSYASMGEVVAWIIGWDLILELFFAAGVVSKAWGLYLDNVLNLFGLGGVDTDGVASGVHNTVHLGGGVTFDLGTVILIAVLATLLTVGTRLSTRFTGVLTAIKVAIVLLIIVVGFSYFSASNLSPFIPSSESFGDSLTHGSVWTQTLFSFASGSELSVGGVFGILAGAGTVFFAFIGFDVVATAAEETRDPRRNVPRGIIGGLVVCTLLYVLVSLALSGMATPEQLRDATPDGGASATIITAFQLQPNAPEWATKVIAVGILVGLTTVVMVLMLGLTRVVFAMSRDGLLPRGLSKTSARFGTPVRLQIGGAVLIALVTAFTRVDVLGNMVNIGTLSAFVLVSFGVPLLRKRRKAALALEGKDDASDHFRVPWSPALPIISGVLCIWLMLQLDVETWVRFLVWLAVGFAIYFGYSYRNSQLHKNPDFIAADYREALQESVGIEEPRR
ncbi:APC family permease [Xylanimonas ulmi]|uniref:Amino acid/polyamine/organocation transporter (APC superfamily) n=1 Tax=Xylanimonas ulmi TaxID=228973 RepID=A0A4Q7LZB6_9MICO|nr:amino acid permease [Xylanibacterium ulmi]RZS59893.1 amino acid/polyamine/organocation transporter (APC superfamily) [Xylanibacterium ulmi]